MPRSDADPDRPVVQQKQSGGRSSVPTAIRDLLRASERARLLAALVGSSDDAIIAWNPEGVVTAWNAGAERLYGYREDEMIGRSIFPIIPPEPHEALRSAHERTLKGEHVAPFETRRLTRGGRAVDVSACLSAIRDERGRLLGIAAIERDVTSARRAAQALAQSEASLANAQRIAHLGNWDWDIGTNELSWSAEIYRVFGVEPTRFGATYDAFLALVHPEDRPLVTAAVEQALVDGRPYALDHRLIRPDGEVRIVHEQGEVTRSGNGEPLRMSGTVQDVTSLRQAQAEVVQRSAELARERELSAQKSQFVNSVSHELRTPLTAIFGYAELLEDEVAGSLTPEQATFVARLEDGARQLRRLVDDLLDAARLDAGTFRLQLERADPALRIRDVLADLAPAIAAAGLVTSIAVPVGEGELALDPQRIGQVVANLVGNALKFTPPGGTISVCLRWEPTCARCEVQDTGPGIAPEDLPLLFKRFSQLAAGKARGGTGLGLSISKGIIEAHGGEIGVESQPGQGSTFWFTLPRDRAGMAAPGSPAG